MVVLAHRWRENILIPDERLPSPFSGLSLHLLAQRCDVARCFDDALAPLLVLVELVTETLEHWHERRDIRCVHVFLVEIVLLTCHCRAGYFRAREDDEMGGLFILIDSVGLARISLWRFQG